MKIKQLAVLVVTSVAFMGQASFAQVTPAPGANVATGGAIGGVAVGTVVVGAIVAGVVVAASAGGGNNPTTGTTAATGTN